MRITKETQMVEKLVDEYFPHCLKDVPRAYRYNPASIRIRIIDKQFAGLNDPKRLRLVRPLLQTLPEKTQADIVFLVLLTPDEAKDSWMDAKYMKPLTARKRAVVGRKQRAVSNGRQRRSA
jgi:stress-induced morphogen